MVFICTQPFDSPCIYNQTNQIFIPFLVYLTFLFLLGPRPNTQKNTQAVLVVSGKVLLDKPLHEWDVRVEEEDGSTATLEVFIILNNIFR